MRHLSRGPLTVFEGKSRRPDSPRNLRRAEVFDEMGDSESSDYLTRILGLAWHEHRTGLGAGSAVPQFGPIPLSIFLVGIGTLTGCFARGPAP